MFLSRYSLGARLAMGVFGLILLGVVASAGYRLRGYGQQAIIKAKIELVGKNIVDLADGLNNYHKITNTFLPMMMTPDGPTLDTEHWGKKYPDIMSQFVKGDLTDPFTPDNAPLRYWTDGSGWTIWSIGPDGKYDLTDPKLYGWPNMEAQARMADKIYSWNNGPKSKGDVVLIYRAAPEE